MANDKQEIRGKAKEVVGKIADDKNMTAEGKADQVKSAAKDLGNRVKEAAKDVKDVLER